MKNHIIKWSLSISIVYAYTYGLSFITHRIATDWWVIPTILVTIIITTILLIYIASYNKEK